MEVDKGWRILIVPGHNKMQSYRAGLSAWLSFLFTSLAVSAVQHCSAGKWEYRVTDQFTGAGKAYRKLQVEL